jgi:hypothetical protein
MTNLKLEGWNETTREASKSEVMNWKEYTDKKHNRLVVFDSSSDLIEAWKTNTVNKVWPSEMRNQRNKSWMLGNDYKTPEQTIEALENGEVLPRYMNRVDTIKGELFRNYPSLTELTDIALGKRRRRKFGEDGSELDIDRYMSGDPAMWSSCPPSQIRKRSARIYVDVWGTCGTNFNTFIENIVFAVALADIIEAAGVSLEIVVGTTATNFWSCNNDCTVAFPVKKHDEPIDVARILSFGIVGFLRMVMFETYFGIDRFNYSSSCGTLIYDIEKAKSLVPLDCDIIMKGGDAYTDPNRVAVTVEKIKTMFGTGEPAAV